MLNRHIEYGKGAPLHAVCGIETSRAFLEERRVRLLLEQTGQGLIKVGHIRPCANRCGRLGSLRGGLRGIREQRSEEHTSELQSLMRISYAVFCLKKKTQSITYT